MSSSNKMQQLESKIAELKSQQEELINQRNLDISKLIARIALNHIDDKTLAGALLEIKMSTGNQDKQEAWHDAGSKFLRRNKNPKNSLKANPHNTAPSSNNNADES